MKRVRLRVASAMRPRRRKIFRLAARPYAEVIRAAGRPMRK
jgi:hypothetical protein